MLEKQLSDPKLFKQQCYIAGNWCDSDDKNIIEVFNPSNLEKIGHVANISLKQVKSAITSAQSSLKTLKNMSAKERSDILYKWHDLIIDACEDLAKIIVFEQGKTLKQAIAEVKYSASFVKWFAQEARRTYGHIIPSTNHEKIMVHLEAVGVVSIITPWNFPSSMMMRKISPAFAVGCACVVKPSELAPYSALALVELAIRAGVPVGAINIVTGDADLIGTELTTNPSIKKVSFTGSTRVGKIIMSNAASSIKRLSLELGGNAPFIIFEDANLDQALSGLMAGKFRNNGQSCISPNRIYLHDDIYEQFIEKLKIEVGKIKLGDCFDKETTLGPLINQASIDKITKLLEDATSKKAKIIQGGKKANREGYFFEPTIIIDVTHEMNIAQNEIFGPVIAIYRFSDEDQVINMANDTSYGLASYIYTKDATRIFRMNAALEYGMVGINEALISSEIIPFGGIKESGFGREGSYLGINEYVNVKYSCWNLS